jgi:hypothetical protein
MFGESSEAVRERSPLAVWLTVAALSLCCPAAADPGAADPGPGAMADEAAERETAEIAARNVLFEALDGSGEGYVTRGEARAHPELAQQFEALDADGDGRISRAEFAAFETGDLAAPAADAAGRSADQAPPDPQDPPPRPQHPAFQTPPASAAAGDPAGAPPSQPAPRPGEGPDDGESAPNVLALRAEVAAMAYETVDALETHTTIPLAEPVGWAVFSAVRLEDELAPGTGMARHGRGEEYFLFMSGVPHTDEIVRYVLSFDDEGLFRDFRQGQLDGPTLERARAQGFMEAYQVTVADGLEVQPIELGAFTFELDGELERALIGVPSVTEEFVDPADPWTRDR